MIILFFFKIQYPPHLRSKNYEIASKISHSSKAFQEYQKFALISLKYLVFILLNFLSQKCSIFNNFHLVGPNTTKSPQCTFCSLRAFQQYQEHNGGVMAWSSWHDKQNKQTTFPNRYICLCIIPLKFEAIDIPIPLVCVYVYFDIACGFK